MSDKGYTLLYDDFIRSEKLDIFEKALLSVFLSYKDCDKIYPSHETLSKQTGMSIRQIIRTQLKLKKRGYIKVKKDPSCRSNLYSVTEKAMTHSHSTVTDRHRGCDSQSQVGVTDRRIIITNIKTTNIKEKKSIKEKKLNNNLPTWLDKEAWAGWVEHRNVDIKKKLTEKAIKLQLKMLGKYKDQHVQIIEYSIMNGYTGLIEPKSHKNFNNKKPSNFLEVKEVGKYDHLG